MAPGEDAEDSFGGDAVDEHERTTLGLFITARDCFEFCDGLGESGVEVAGKLSHSPRAERNGIGRSGTTLQPLPPKF